ncbi:hypothetical protein E2C01_049384 [Portunus trituberculatus]|uniref:Uncharacterized protein n=1 Tax=Portunus trituberculatus TaxID=210409 RepID=A0A5B7GCX8_PORTR|nr:hypothetical protein [Portunus trituberculatus]
MATHHQTRNNPPSKAQTCSGGRGRQSKVKGAGKLQETLQNFYTRCLADGGREIVGCGRGGGLRCGLGVKWVTGWKTYIVGEHVG